MVGLLSFILLLMDDMIKFKFEICFLCWLHSWWCKFCDNVGGSVKKIRKPKPWKHPQPITKTQLAQLRDEFWDTAPHYGGRKGIYIHFSMELLNCSIGFPWIPVISFSPMELFNWILFLNAVELFIYSLLYTPISSSMVILELFLGCFFILEKFHLRRKDVCHIIFWIFLSIIVCIVLISENWIPFSLRLNSLALGP